MFIGHFGIGFAAKRISNKLSLGTLFMASQFIDLLWPFLLLLGIERVEIDPGNTAFTPLDFVYYPFSHSFIAVLIWGVLFGAIYYLLRKNLKNAAILGALVLSHWFLDLIVHRPDLPLTFDNDYKVGFGLWNSIPFSIIIEGLIFGAGVYFYSKATRSLSKKGIYSLWGLILFLVLVYVMNIVGPPPDATEPIAYIGLTQWILIIWAYWVDRNRTGRFS